MGDVVSSDAAFGGVASVLVTDVDGKQAKALAAVLVGEDGVAGKMTSGITASANFTPAAGPYSANDIMDVAKEFAFTYADGSAVRPGALIRILTTIIKIDATALQASEAAYALQCYSVTPPSAQADNAAWALASADLTAYRGTISLGTPVDLGAALYVKSPNIDLDIKLAGSSLWGQLQTLAGFTPSAVARQVLLYGVEL